MPSRNGTRHGPDEGIRLRYLRQQREHADGDQITGVNDRTEKPAVPRWGIFDHHEYSSTPLAAEADALKQTQEDKENRCCNAYLVVFSLGRRPIKKIRSPMMMIVIASMVFRPTQLSEDRGAQGVGEKADCVGADVYSVNGMLSVS
jgi:hypothetical protein